MNCLTIRRHRFHRQLPRLHRRPRQQLRLRRRLRQHRLLQQLHQPMWPRLQRYQRQRQSPQVNRLGQKLQVVQSHRRLLQWQGWQPEHLVLPVPPELQELQGQLGQPALGQVLGQARQLEPR